MKRALWFVISVLGCAKHEEPAPTPVQSAAPIASSVAPVPSPPPSASPPPPPAPIYIRLPVAITNAREAFDGDPFTVFPGKGPIEGKLAQKRKIKHVRVVGEDLKKITISFDGGKPKEMESGDLDVDLDAVAVKVTAEGKVAEVELHGELSVGIATVPEDIAQRVKELEGKPSPVELLAKLGVIGAKPGLVESTRVYRAQLDRDSDQEGIVSVATANRTYLVFFDDAAHGMAVVGVREVARCAGAANDPVVKLIPLHHAAFADVAITWKSCDGSDPGGMLVTLDRGMAETLWTFHGKQDLHFGGGFPKIVEMLEGAKVAERHVFDPIAYRYR